MNGPGVCLERFFKHDTPKWLTNLCPGGFQHSVTRSLSPSNKNTDGRGQKNWVGTQTLTKWTKRVIVGSGAISPALWPFLRTLIDGQWVISRYDKVLWRVGLLSCWWLYVSTCGLCLCADERERERERAFESFALRTGQQLGPLRLQWNPVKSSQFLNDGVMLVLERKDIRERIKLQALWGASPIFGPILLHASDSPTLFWW